MKRQNRRDVAAPSLVLVPGLSARNVRPPTRFCGARANSLLQVFFDKIVHVHLGFMCWHVSNTDLMACVFGGKYLLLPSGSAQLLMPLTLAHSDRFIKSLRKLHFAGEHGCCLDHTGSLQTRALRQKL